MSHIFISYSRKDLETAKPIVNALAAKGFDIWIDWEDIPKGEEFYREIDQGIEEADAFLFLVSPDSVESDWCNKEIAHAVKNNKRILPIVIRDTDPKTIPPDISGRNWLPCRDGLDDFSGAIEEIYRTINTDYKWLKYHARLQVKALDWQRRRDNSRLLRGKELREATQKLIEINSQTDPQPTNLIQEYVRTSRKNEERQRRQVIVGFGVVLLIITILSILRATAQANAEQQARISLSRKLAAGAQTVLFDHPQESLLLSIESLKTLKPGDPTITNGEQSLRDALLQAGGIALGQGISLEVAPVFSPDNHWLVAGSMDGAVKLWDLTSSDLPDATLLVTANNDPIQALTITEDSRWLIGASSDSVIQLWDLNNIEANKKPIEISVNGCPVHMLRASPNGQWLVIICDNDEVMVWDLAAHNISTLPVTLQRKDVSEDTGIFGPDVGFLPADREQLADISQNSRWFVMASSNAAFLWNLDPPGISAQPAVINGYKFPITAVSISPDNHWLAVADAKSVLLWDLTAPDPTAKPIWLTEHFLLSTISFNAESSLLAAGSSDGVVRIWDLTSTDPANAFFDVEGQAPSMKAMAFSPDHHWMITAGADVRLLDISNTLFNSAPLILSGYENPVTSIKVSSNSRWIVTLDSDTSLRLWDLDSPQPSASPITLWAHYGQGSIKTLAASPSKNHWLAISGGNGISLWDLTIPKFQTSPIFLSDRTATALAISPNNRWLAAGYQDGSTLLWDLESQITNKGFMTLVGHTDSVNSLAFSPNGQWLATGSQDQSVRLWDLSQADPAINPTILSAKTGGVIRVSFSADENWLVMIGSEDTYLWDLTGSDSSNYTSMSIGKEISVENAVFSPDNHWLAMGRDDTRLIDLTSPNLESGSTYLGIGTPMAISSDSLWLVALNYETPQLLNLRKLTSDPIPLFGHESRITSMSFSSDGQSLFTGSWDDTVRIWNLKSTDPGSSFVTLQSPKNWLPHINVLTVTPDNHWLITGTDGGSVYLWTLDQEELIRLACQTAGRNLYQVEWEQYYKTGLQKTCSQWTVGK